MHENQETGQLKKHFSKVGINYSYLWQHNLRGSKISSLCDQQVLRNVDWLISSIYLGNENFCKH
ncbi:hypothetical protein Pyn_07832 [Prunus yedoensis var. nudiflora]|uniref:Uncharacterized protein n=1 Tax=Prunus yedoensis var. nudiflora TaxID=2094558 RepID=A0A314ZML5_PRUYE|nr:hypothetical protein Pyn_07832 [Prunus yedoensis var. nudiflora]